VTGERVLAKIAIIFGGHGFIGSHLARRLVESGAYARVVSADIADEPRFVTEGVEYVRCDVRETIPADLVAEATEIYNLAAVHITPGYEDWEYFWTNVRGATNVCDYARRAGIDTIVFTSSISVYGRSEEPLDEGAQLHPDSAYGRSKLCAERIHHLWRDEVPERRRLIVARPAVVFGYMERGNFTRMAKMLKAGLFVYPGRKTTIKSCGYVRDLVESFLFFLAKAVSTVTYNFSYTERFTTEAICEAFHRVAGYGVPKLVFPVRPMMAGGWTFEMLAFLGLKTSINRARIGKLIFSTNIVPKILEESGFRHKYDLSEALADWFAQSGSGKTA
jgi:GlcNAc-P-P-Und epimerase